MKFGLNMLLWTDHVTADHSKLLAQIKGIGDTKLDNLLLLCTHHHRVVHRDGWQVDLLADGTAVFVSSRGVRFETRPRGHPRQRAA